MTLDSRFNYAVSVVFKHEGGFSDDIDDPGGATRYGISLRYLKSEGIDIDDDGDVDSDDIRKLSLQKASDIYRKNWWLKHRFNEIHDLNLATKLFDLSVNMGARQAIKLAQRCVGVKDDGIMGSITLKKLNSLDADDVMNCLRKKAFQFYCDLIDKKPVFNKYRNGWLMRAMW